MMRSAAVFACAFSPFLTCTILHPAVELLSFQQTACAGKLLVVVVGLILDNAVVARFQEAQEAHCGACSSAGNWQKKELWSDLH